MNHEAFSRLRELLLGLPKDRHFDLDTWMVPNLRDGLTPDVMLLPQHACGSTACAIGHAATDPWFMKEGLHLRMETIFLGFPNPNPRLMPIPFYTSLGGTTYRSFDAVSRFFEISLSTATALFDPGGYAPWEMSDHNITVKDFVRKLDQLVAIEKIWSQEKNEFVP